MRAQARNIAILVISLALLAGASLLFISPTADTSSRGVGRTGSAALYDSMQQLGYPVQRIEGGFDLRGLSTLLNINPVVAYSDSEAEQLAIFVRDGGTLIVASSDPTVLAPALRLGHVGIDGVATTTHADPASASVAAKVGRIAVRDPLILLPPDDATSLLKTGAGVVAASVPLGTGQLVIVADGYIFDNDGLRQADNALLVRYLVESRSGNGGSIGFDDFHHSLQSEDGQSAILHSPLGLALGLAVVVVVGFAISSGRNLGTPIPAGDPGRVPTSASYINSMAQLFSRAGTRGGVAARYTKDCRARIGAITGVAADLDDAAFVAALSGIDIDLGARTGAALDRAIELAKGNPSEAELIEMAIQIDAVEHAWSQPLAQWRP